MANWWTNKSTEAFNERTKCLIDQYNGYKVGNSHVSQIPLFIFFASNTVKPVF